MSIDSPLNIGWKKYFLHVPACICTKMLVECVPGISSIVNSSLLASCNISFNGS